MRIIGLDLGAKSLGIAISDELQIIARPLTTYYFKEDNYKQASSYLIDLCQKEKVTKIVLGLPKHMNGDMGIRANISLEFKKLIEDNSNIKVILLDERLTTSMVDKLMLEGNLSREKRRSKKDELAAQVILQNYLDRRK